jgi:hypothetical protein
MKPLFAILIPTTPDRQRLLDRVMDQLNEQRKGHECIIIINEDNYEKTTGRKRNELLDAAREQGATNIAFVDSDDLVGPNYVELNMKATNRRFDCMELWGQYYENGKQMNPFHHSIIHDHWWQDDRFYYRNPNHLSNIRLDHLNDIVFQDKTVGEDAHYSIDIQKTGRLKNQYPVNEIIYYYFAGGRKDHLKEPIMAARRGTAL